MIVIVKQHEILLKKEEEINEKEVNVSKCIFEFDEEITDEFIKEAIFVKDDKTIVKIINNNECDYPPEILDSVGACLLGVVATLTEGEEIVKRFNPTPKKFFITEGILREADNSEPITASELEQYQQALQNGLNEVKAELQRVIETGNTVASQGQYAQEQGDYAKEQAQIIIDSNAVATKIIKEFEENVEQHTTNFNENATTQTTNYNDNAKEKLETYNSNAETKTTDFNKNASDKTKTFNENVETKTTDYNANSEVKIKAYDDNAIAKLKEYNDNATLKVEEYNSNATEKLENYNSNATAKTEEFNQNASNYEKRITENEKDIIDIESYLDSLTPKATEKGELVHITDALGLPVFETKTSGNVKQETTKGNQLYNYKVTTQISSGISVDEDGWVTATYDNTNGTETKYLNYWTHNLNLKLNTDYLIVTEIKNVSGLGALQVVSKSGTTGQFIAQHAYQFSNLSNNSINLFTEKTVSSFDGIYDGLRTFVSFSAGRSGSITFRLSVLEDTTVTPETFVYEKYTGGQASPNPEYPQEIEVLEGYNLYLGWKIGQSIHPDTGVIYDNTTAATSLDYIKVDFDKNPNYYFSGFSDKLYSHIDAYDKDFNYLGRTPANPVSFYLLNKNSFTANHKDGTIAYLNACTYQHKSVTGTIDLVNDLKTILNVGSTQKQYLPYGCVGYKVNGKNKFNIGNISDYSPNTNLTISDNNISKTIDDGNASYCVKNTKYYMNKLYISADYDRSGVTPRYIIRAFDSNGNELTTSVNGWSYLAYYKGYYRDDNGYFELPNASYIQIGFGFKGTAKEIGTYSNIMLSEYDDEYEPYQEQIVPLDLKGNWIGATKDAKDLLVTDKKYLWLVKNVGKYTFNGNETGWVESTSENTILVFLRTGAEQKDITYDGLYSNLFINKNIYNIDEQGFYLSKTGNFVFRINYDLLPEGVNDLQRAKNYLVENNCYFYYPLLEPYTEDLGELPEPIKTFEGTNNIQVLANLDTEIEVKYALDLKKYYDNKLAEISAQII